MTDNPKADHELGVPASPSGCQPSASAPDGSSRSGIPNAEPVICAWCSGASPWRPIATAPRNERVLLGSYYDSFRLRHPFVPIWQMTEGHTFEWSGVVEFSLRGRLNQVPTHWMPIPTPPEYEPSDEQLAIASGIEARRAETGTGSVHESPVPEGQTPPLQSSTRSNDRG